VLCWGKGCGVAGGEDRSSNRLFGLRPLVGGIALVRQIRR